MQISEIFSSIDGEGIRTGYLVTFIRTQFCNLRCKWGDNWCDTTYSWDENDVNGNKQYKDMTIEEIMNECEKLGNKRITFTGGEPLIQKEAHELISKLTIAGYEVNIETNGAVDLMPFKDPNIEELIDQYRVIYTMDWKSPSSGMRNKMIENNLGLLNEHDVLKFVVSNKEDLDDMLNVITNHTLRCEIFVSPVYGAIEGAEIVDYMKEHNLQKVRVQIQLHKYFYPVDMRGV